MASEQLEEFRFNWRLQNLVLCDKLHGASLCSPEFVVSSLNNSKWNLLLYPRGWYGINYISCYLKNIDLNIEDITIYFEILICGIDGKQLGFGVVQRHTFKKNAYWGFDKLLEINKLNNSTIWSEDILNISCCMRRLDNKHPIGCNAFTNVLFDRFTFYWDVPKFQSKDWNAKKMCKFDENYSIEAVLTAPNEDILMTIERKCKQYSDGVIKCKITLLDIAGEEQVSKIASHCFDSYENIWKFPSLIKKSQIIDKKDTLFRDGLFTLQLEFIVSNGRYLDVIEKYNYENSVKLDSPNTNLHNTSYCSIRDDFAKLYNSKEHSDIKFKVNGTEFAAHKSVLVARSKVFGVMFNQNMREAQNGLVEIEDIDEETFKYFLDFIYTDEMKELNSETALNLVIVSNKYQVLGLEEKCAAFLKSSLTTTNVCEILLTADMIQHKVLKSTAISFIKKHSTQVLHTFKWCEWVVNNHKLATEVFSELNK